MSCTRYYDVTVISDERGVATQTVESLTNYDSADEDTMREHVGACDDDYVNYERIDYDDFGEVIHCEGTHEYESDDE
jgi:hypothetical protein